MKKSNFWRMLLIVTLIALFAPTSHAQSNEAKEDSICYSLDEATLIASMLIDGKNCADELLSTLQSYKDAKDELKLSDKLLQDQNAVIASQNGKITQLEKKVKRRNTWLWILSTATLIISTQL